MNFLYGEMNTVSVSGMRLYESPNGKLFPSITTVLGATQSQEKQQTLNNWRDAIGHAEADAQTAAAAEKGTGVHLLIERFLKGEDLYQQDTFTPEMIGGMNCLKPKLKNINEVWGQEVALCSEIIEVAGRCDCVGLYKGVPSIIDFKTSRRLKSKDEIEDYYLQLTAYSIMHNEMFNTDISNGVILMASASGFPQEFAVNLEKYVDPLMVRVNKFYEKLAEEHV